MLKTPILSLYVSREQPISVQYSTYLLQWSLGVRGVVRWRCFLYFGVEQTKWFSVSVSVVCCISLLVSLLFISSFCFGVVSLFWFFVVWFCCFCLFLMFSDVGLLPSLFTWGCCFDAEVAVFSVFLVSFLPMTFVFVFLLLVQFVFVLVLFLFVVCLMFCCLFPFGLFLFVVVWFHFWILILS